MANIRSFILYQAEHTAKAPVSAAETLAFASVIDVKTFELMQTRIGKSFFGMLVADSHYANAMHMLKHAYEAKAQYVKLVGNRMQQAFVKKGKSMVLLGDGSFTVDLNAVRKRVKEIYGADAGSVMVPMMIFDSSYTGCGVVYDMARILGMDTKAFENDTKLVMELNDAQIYIARWGGAPGEEKWSKPFDMRP
jgi:hypothetical protein